MRDKCMGLLHESCTQVRITRYSIYDKCSCMPRGWWCTNLEIGLKFQS